MNTNTKVEYGKARNNTIRFSVETRDDSVYFTREFRFIFFDVSNMVMGELISEYSTTKDFLNDYDEGLYSTLDGRSLDIILLEQHFLKASNDTIHNPLT